MPEHLLSHEEKMHDYEVTVEAKMPGLASASKYKIPVKARNNSEALIKGEEVWRKAVEPTDIRVKKTDILVD